jgi:hypothetical protein
MVSHIISGNSKWVDDYRMWRAVGNVALDVEGMESKDFQGLYNGGSIHLIPNTNIFLLHEG